MEYERMKYAHDQRAWVKAADEKIPKLLDIASGLQQRAAENWQYQSLYPFMRDMVAADYAEARMYLFRAIYYNGMREANR